MKFAILLLGAAALLTSVDASALRRAGAPKPTNAEMKDQLNKLDAKTEMGKSTQELSSSSSKIQEKMAELNKMTPDARKKYIAKLADSSKNMAMMKSGGKMKKEFMAKRHEVTATAVATAEKKEANMAISVNIACNTAPVPDDAVKKSITDKSGKVSYTLLAAKMDVKANQANRIVTAMTSFSKYIAKNLIEIIPLVKCHEERYAKMVEIVKKSKTLNKAMVITNVATTYSEKISYFYDRLTASVKLLEQQITEVQVAIELAYTEGEKILSTEWTPAFTEYTAKMGELEACAKESDATFSMVTTVQTRMQQVIAFSKANKGCKTDLGEGKFIPPPPRPNRRQITTSSTTVTASAVKERLLAVTSEGTFGKRPGSDPGTAGTENAAKNAAKSRFLAVATTTDPAASLDSAANTLLAHKHEALKTLYEGSLEDIYKVQGASTESMLLELGAPKQAVTEMDGTTLDEARKQTKAVAKDAEGQAKTMGAGDATGTGTATNVDNEAKQIFAEAEKSGELKACDNSNEDFKKILTDADTAFEKQLKAIEKNKAASTTVTSAAVNRVTGVFQTATTAGTQSDWRFDVEAWSKDGVPQGKGIVEFMKKKPTCVNEGFFQGQAEFFAHKGDMDQAVELLEKRLTWLRGATVTATKWALWAYAQINRGTTVTQTTTTYQKKVSGAVVQDTIKSQADMALVLESIGFAMGDIQDFMEWIMQYLSQLKNFQAWHTTTLDAFVQGKGVIETAKTTFTADISVKMGSIMTACTSMAGFDQIVGKGDAQVDLKVEMETCIKKVNDWKDCTPKLTAATAATKSFIEVFKKLTVKLTLATAVLKGVLEG